MSSMKEEAQRRIGDRESGRREVSSRVKRMLAVLRKEWKQAPASR
jgi:hypothetical protein